MPHHRRMTTPIDSDADFAALPLSPALRAGIDALGYTAMTPVQAQALPIILDGRDLIAQAPTGSGKTAAFGLGLLHRLDPALAQTQALVLCPTRELADQVGKQLRKLATGIANLKISILCGGIPLGPQLASLAHEPHVVVGTPGRIQELMQKKALQPGAIRTLVLDEADRMLDMGFEDAIRDLVRRIPKDRQSLLFSATFPEAIVALGKAMLRDAQEVRIDGGAEPASIEQLFFEAEPGRKAPLLAALLLHYRPASCVVFCNMRKSTEEVVGSLAHYGFSALALHGDMEQRDREEVLVRFANRSCSVLVASDVAARGLDVDDLGAVINYDLPSDADTYLHRIGRTGRAGRAGTAITIVCPADFKSLAAIEKLTGQAIPKADLPGYDAGANEAVAEAGANGAAAGKPSRSRQAHDKGGESHARGGKREARKPRRSSGDRQRHEAPAATAAASIAAPSPPSIGRAPAPRREAISEPGDHSHLPAFLLRPIRARG